jgi:hypothetical protein
MRYWRTSMMVSLMFFLLPMVLVSSETIIIKNATVYLPNGRYLENSYIRIKGIKLQQIGNMAELKDGIYDQEYDLKGCYVYPAFIDSYYRGFQDKESEDPQKTQGRSHYNRSDYEKLDRRKKGPLKERNYHVEKMVINNINLKGPVSKKLLSNGFTLVQVVPENGILAGTTAVLSLVSTDLGKAVLDPGKYMTLYFNRNSRKYPTTFSSLIAELKQLKEDSLYHQKMKKIQFYDDSDRVGYKPELDVLLPYFLKEKRFLIVTMDLVQQRLAEILKKELDVNPVLVGSSDIWRRKVDSNWNVILPLTFDPPAGGKYAFKGEKIKKNAKEKIYPKRIAEFIKNHKHISLTAPETGNYRDLFKNIRLLIKNGLTEAEILNALTINPAQLLGLEKFAGAIKPGLLANLVVSDKKIFEEKAKITKTFVEGKLIEFDSKKEKKKPAARNLTGNWLVTVKSPMRNLEFKMTIKQEGNEFTGKLISARGEIEIYEGSVSGNEVNFSGSTSPEKGLEMEVKVSGKLVDQKIEGTITLGPIMEGSFSAIPESDNGGAK